MKQECGLLQTKISLIFITIWLAMGGGFYYLLTHNYLHTSSVLEAVILYSTLMAILIWLCLQFLVVRRIKRISALINRIDQPDLALKKLIAGSKDEIASIAASYQLATHDQVTGLPNRYLLKKAFGYAAEQLTNIENKIVIVFIDLDRFKRINDTLSHDAGDEILKTTAKRITACLRPVDFAAHFGGDEFVVMLIDVETEQIEAITRRIFKSINQPVNYHEHEIYISCSMGVCVYPDDGLTLDELIRQADKTLYHAKEEGRNRYQFYSASLNDSIDVGHRREFELQKALDQHEFVLFYQPIFDMRTKQISSLEALIRWKHPEKGLLGAGEVIPYAESTNLMNPIGEWVLKETCRQIKEWKDKGIAVVPIAINVSSDQLAQTGLCEKIIRIIHEADINPSLLQFEITETGFINITRKLINELVTLNAFGIKLVIDDFGTGYSGLGYLKSLPVSKLKIDQSFVRDLLTDPDDKSITLAIIAIAHELKLRVTAEGIENVEQYHFMTHHAVDEVQGHFLSEPLSSEECEKYLTGEKLIQQS